MTILKEREKSMMQRVLESLNRRTTLSDSDLQTFSQLEKGFEGEQRFDQFFIEFVDDDYLLINDLLLIINGTTIQIDSLLITGQGIYMYEIKNFKGEYMNSPNYLKTFSGEEILNPVNQLNRTVVVLRQLLKQWQVRMELTTAVIYVNPQFTLYKAEETDNIILPTALPYHLMGLNRKRRPLTRDHHTLAERLLKAHQTEASFQKKRSVYDYESLRKGLTCVKCGSFDLSMTERLVFCIFCHKKALLEDTVIRNIEEYKLLFPDNKVTRKAIYEWCGCSVKERRIWRILSTHYALKGYAGSAHYYIKEK